MQRITLKTIAGDVIVVSSTVPDMRISTDIHGNIYVCSRGVFDYCVNDLYTFRCVHNHCHANNAYSNAPPGESQLVFGETNWLEACKVSEMSSLMLAELCDVPVECIDNCTLVHVYYIIGTDSVMHLEGGVDVWSEPDKLTLVTLDNSQINLPDGRIIRPGHHIIKKSIDPN
jgi:hypothetical protein